MAIAATSCWCGTPTASAAGAAASRSSGAGPIEREVSSWSSRLRPAARATVLLKSGVGLDGMTGVPRWRAQLEAPRHTSLLEVLDPGNQDRLPLLVSQAQDASICRATLPATASGTFAPPRGNAVPPGLARDDLRALDSSLPLGQGDPPPDLHDGARLRVRPRSGQRGVALRPALAGGPPTSLDRAAPHGAAHRRGGAALGLSDDRADDSGAEFGLQLQCRPGSCSSWAPSWDCRSAVYAGGRLVAHPSKVEVPGYARRDHAGQSRQLIAGGALWEERQVMPAIEHYDRSGWYLVIIEGAYAIGCLLLGRCPVRRVDHSGRWGLPNAESVSAVGGLGQRDRPSDPSSAGPAAEDEGPPRRA